MPKIGGAKLQGPGVPEMLMRRSRQPREPGGRPAPTIRDCYDVFPALSKLYFAKTFHPL